jgi:dTDP-4-dehydrorhamnose reductase
MRFLVTGASGQLGGYLLRELSRQGEPVTAWSGAQSGSLFGVLLRPVDLADPDSVARAFREARPAVVLHAGAVSQVAACFRDPVRARQVNAAGTACLTELAAEAGARLVLVSTDLVFDGTRGGYREGDAVAPLSVYGQTKADAERAVRAAPGGVVARVSLLFGPPLVGRPSFFEDQAAALRAGRPCTLFTDEWRTPLGLQAAAEALLVLARSDFTGLLHLGGPERLSRFDMGRRLAAWLGCDPDVLMPVYRSSSSEPEPRPADVSLDSSLWRRLFPKQGWPTWEEALRQMGVPGR